MRIHPRIRHTSPDLASLFRHQRAEGVPLANDASFGVGFAPFDELESVVLAVERRLDSREVKAAHPEIGEDIKVMGARRGDAIVLTVGCRSSGVTSADLLGYRRTRGRRPDRDSRGGSIEHGRVDVGVNLADGERCTLR